MAIVDLIRKPMINLFIERPGLKLSLAEWSQRLAKDGDAIDQRVAKSQSPQAGTTLRHITGIERWGQRRLQVALGEPPVQDEYDGYQPAADLDVTALREAFRATRETTVTLAQQLAAANLDPAFTISHNQFGPLSVRGWLSYLNTHANFESKRIR
ncbi:MAG: DinB family protein [Caldilineaceae bacterium]